MGSKPFGISGSRAAAVLGLSPWATPFRVWQDIMEDIEPGFNARNGFEWEAFEGNAATRWGHAFEGAIISLAEPIADDIIGDQEGRYVPGAYNGKLDFITCHIDGRYSKNPDTLHEGKTVNAFAFGDKWGEPGTDKIPIEYQIQVQHQMLCTGAKQCIVSVLIFPKRPEEWEELGWYVGPHTGYHGQLIVLKDNSGAVSPLSWAQTLWQMGFFKQYTVKANPAMHEKMLQRYIKWWENHVLCSVPPEPEVFTDIRAMIQAPAGTIVLDEKTVRMYREFKDIGEEIGASGDAAKKREQLKMLILKRARKLEATLDDESTDKWIFYDAKGNKVGSYGRNVKGQLIFR